MAPDFPIAKVATGIPFGIWTVDIKESNPFISPPPMGGGDMNGLDSLMSTVQMPKGIPVATFAIGKSGAINAALCAVQILSLADSNLSEKFDQFRKDQTEEVIQINSETN